MPEELDEAAILEEAIECHHRGEYARTVELCTQLIEAADDWSQPFYFRGAARLELGEAEAALTDLTRAIELEPEIPYFAFHDRGRALADLGRYEEALAEYQHAIALRPDRGSTRARMALTLYQLGRLDESLAAYTEAIRLEPGRADYYSDRGAVHLNRRQFDEAVADLTQAIELDPSADHYFSRGTAYWRKRRDAEALEDFNQAIEQEPAHARAWYARGYLHFSSGRRQQGEAEFARAVELDANLEDWPYEQRWVHDQAKRVEAYLHSRGFADVVIEEDNVWDLAPYLAIWHVEAEEGDLWVITGDCPTDSLPGTEIDNIRQALEAFSRRWSVAAAGLAAGKDEFELAVGPPEGWPELGDLLQRRASLLLDFANSEFGNEPAQ